MKNKKIISIVVVLVGLVAIFTTVAFFNKDKQVATVKPTTSNVKSSTSESSTEKVIATTLENATKVNLSENPNLFITQSGTYEVSGSTNNGQITINVADTDAVTLVLNNVDLSNTATAAIAITNGKEVKIETVEGTTNNISSTGEDTENTATIYSKDDLTFTGNGTLAVTSTNQNAIQSKNDLTFTSGTYNLTAKNEAIKGKDSVTFDGGSFTLISESNAVKTTNIEEVDQGVITVNGGSFNIKATGDGFHASTNIVINQGEFTINVEDDGMHADGILEINAGTINVETAYEGLEAADVQIKGGDVTVKTQDDGINGAGGNDSTTTQDSFNSSNGSITISGGKVSVYAGLSGTGDGVDSNGDLAITGGTVIVYVPENARDWSSYDFDGNYSQDNATVTEVAADGTESTVTQATISNFSGMQGGSFGGGPNGR